MNIDATQRGFVLISDWVFILVDVFDSDSDIDLSHVG